MHTRYREKGGEDISVQDELALLRTGGHEVRQFVVDNPTRVGETIRSLAVSAWNRQAAREVTRVAKSFRPDVAHVNNTWFALSPSVLSALRGLNIPTVLTLRNYRVMCVNGLLFRTGRPCEDCIGKLPYPAIIHRCYHDSAVLSGVAAFSIALHHHLETWVKKVDRLIVLSETSRDKFLAAGFPPQKIVLREHFSWDTASRLSPATASNRVLFVGRLSAEKGLEVLLKAWELAGANSFELLIVGDGPLRLRLELIAPSNVRFAGLLSSQEVMEHMKTSRAIVVPSMWYETGGRVLIEALACGLPVIASDSIGIAKTLEDAGAGWRFSTVEELAKAICRLEDDQLMDAASSAGQQLFKSRYGPTPALRSLEKIYQEAIESHIQT